MKKIKLLTSITILTISLLFSSNVFAKDINVVRLSGSNRFDTSNAIVSKGWSQSNYAILCNSDNFPDALSSSVLSKKLNNCPILLTNSNSLTNSTKLKLNELGVKNVYIIGGTAVVSKDIEDILENMKISVKRIYGENRYDTSLAIAKEISGNEKIKGVFVCTGDQFEDALCTAPVASQLGYPIILISSTVIPNTVENYINNNVRTNNGEIILVGGNDTINNGIINELNPNKIYNQATKYERNLALINDFKKQLDTSKIFIASDKGFADALSGSALAALNENPIILVGDNNQGNVNSFINGNDIKNISILGGTGVLSHDAINNIIGISSTPNNTTGSAINSDSDNPKDDYYVNNKTNDSYITIGDKKYQVGDFKPYISGYENKINSVMTALNSSIEIGSTTGGKDISTNHITFGGHKTSTDSLTCDSRIDCTFYKNGYKEISIQNFEGIVNTNAVIDAVVDYFPSEYRKEMLADLNILEEMVAFQLKTNKDNIAQSILAKDSYKKFFNKKWEKDYGYCSMSIYVNQGKVENTVTIGFKDDVNNDNSLNK